MSTVENYLSTFTEHQRFVQSIAIQMLGSSYNIAKSNGFRSWQTKRETEPQIEHKTVEQKPKDLKDTKQVLKVKKGRNPKIKPVYKKLIDSLKSSFDEGTVCLESISYCSLECLPSSGGVYWITDKRNVLFLGTTSDLKKNVILAIKSVRKKTSNLDLIEEINQLIDNKSIDNASSLNVVYLETCDAKERIRIKNKVKIEIAFAPIL